MIQAREGGGHRVVILITLFKFALEERRGFRPLCGLRNLFIHLSWGSRPGLYAFVRCAHLALSALFALYAAAC